MENIRKFGLLAIMFTFIGLGCDEKKPGNGPASILWKIEYEGNTSWIFGTMHAPHSHFNKLPEPVKDALSKSKLFLSEIEPDDKNQVKIMQGMLLPENESLESKIGKIRFERLKSITAKFDPPYTSSFLNRNRIWAASLLVAWPRKSTDPVPMDVLLYQKAKLDGCETRGIETPEEQLAPLDSFTEPEQIQMLEDSLDEADGGYRMLNALTGKYISQDLAGMTEDFYSRKSSFTPQFRDKFINLLLKERNKLFFDRIISDIKTKDCFVAVGAGHLIGDEGLLSLLEKAGCKVTPVEFKFDIPIQEQIPKLFFFMQL